MIKIGDSNSTVSKVLSVVSTEDFLGFSRISHFPIFIPPTFHFLTTLRHFISFISFHLHLLRNRLGQLQNLGHWGEPILWDSVTLLAESRAIYSSIPGSCKDALLVCSKGIQRKWIHGIIEWVTVGCWIGGLMALLGCRLHSPPSHHTHN